jgi:hypothetical protein
VLDAVGVDPERDDAAAALSSMPSSISTARRTSSSGRLMSSSRCSRVLETNARLTADFEVERASSSISSPTGSPVRA